MREKFFNNYPPREGRKGALEYYLKFLNPEGLSPEQTIRFNSFLRQYFEKTGNVWRPTWCRYIPHTVNLADRIAKEVFSLEAKAKAKRFETDHFWLELVGVSENDRLIVDPTGVEKHPSSFHSKSTIPFFGLLKEVRNEHARFIYERAEGVNLKDFRVRSTLKNLPLLI